MAFAFLIAAMRRRGANHSAAHRIGEATSRSILCWTSAPASFLPRLCQTRNKSGLFIEPGLEHNVNVGEVSMRPSVPRGRVVLPRVVLRLSTVHDPVIESKPALLRSSLASRVGPDGPKVWRRPWAPEPSSEPSWLRCVPKRLVASAFAQSPKPSIGPALAELRRAVAAKRCARLTARLAGLAGPGQKRVEEQRPHVCSNVFVFAGSTRSLLGGPE